MGTEKIPPASNVLPLITPTEHQQIEPHREAEKTPSHTKGKVSQPSETEKQTNIGARGSVPVTTLSNHHLAFSVDEKTGKRIIEIINDETKEVIRQIPPEEILGVLANIMDMLGLSIDKKV